MSDIWASLLLLAGQKRDLFQKLKRNFDNAYKHGKENYCLKDDKKVLLIAIVLTILMFAMSCFKISKVLCTDLKRLMVNF